MGGIIGSGIFINPSVVAKLVPVAWLALLVWIIGGGISLLGAGLFAELAARRPNDGGLYAYMRDAFHPAIAFLYGWTLLIVSQSGGMAAAAVTFALYFTPLTGIHADPSLLAVLIMAFFTIINCLGVREGTSTQNLFMIVKIAAIAGFVLVGLFAPHAAPLTASIASSHAVAGGGLILVMGLALVPVMFSYSGWQTSSFMTAELKDPARSLPRGLIFGVLAVVALYLAVNVVCLLSLGINGLGATHTPASDIARLAFGPIGQRIMAAVVAISTLGFLSNQMLVSPRVYFQMAADGIFFRQLAWVHPKTRAPVVAIALQGTIAILLALSNRYDQILNFVTSIDFLFFGLAAISLFIFRAQDARDPASAKPSYQIPWHPYSTAAFLAIAWSIVAVVYIKDIRDAAAGLVILLSGLPLYMIFAARRNARLGAP
jgi:APA family basic amino acid/polyamine antiporter